MNHYHACRFPEALHAVEQALRATSDYNLSGMGRFMYVRGKIFQRLASSATHVNFPTALRPEADSPHTESKMSAGSAAAAAAAAASAAHQATVYTCTGDLLQEAVANFSRAYHFFRAVGDDMRVGKAVAHIAETYLGRLFAPVALLRLPYESVAKLAGFKLSPLAAEKDIPEKTATASKSTAAAPAKVSVHVRALLCVCAACVPSVAKSFIS